MLRTRTLLPTLLSALILISLPVTSPARQDRPENEKESRGGAQQEPSKSAPTDKAPDKSKPVLRLRKDEQRRPRTDRRDRTKPREPRKSKDIRPTERKHDRRSTPPTRPEQRRPDRDQIDRKPGRRLILERDRKKGERKPSGDRRDRTKPREPRKSKDIRPTERKQDRRSTPPTRPEQRRPDRDQIDRKPDRRITPRILPRVPTRTDRRQKRRLSHDRHYRKYRRHNRRDYRRFQTYRYHTYYLAPIRRVYHPIGFRLTLLPSPYVRIVVGGWPYFYFDGVFYRQFDSGYAVVNAPIGAVVSTLPVGFISFSLGAFTYYYVNETYYVWDEDQEAYVVVETPEGADEAIARETEGRLFVYPNEGQSEEQQAKDRYACHRWAVEETGVDPIEDDEPLSRDHRRNYRRAITACLEGRGYTVK